MSSEKTSQLGVDIPASDARSSCHSLGVYVTSRHLVASSDLNDSGIDVSEDRVDGPQAACSDCDSGSVSSSGTEENAGMDVCDGGGATCSGRPTAPCYEHAVSHVEPTSRLQRLE